jgi:hypothetical protein
MYLYMNYEDWDSNLNSTTNIKAPHCGAFLMW